MALTRGVTFVTLASAVWLAASAAAWSQGASQVIGAWQLTKETGSSGGLGPSAKGMLTLADGGVFMLQIVNGNMKPFAADDWRNATPAENQASGNGSLAYFGTYETNSGDHTLILHIARSSYPNWLGTDQTWAVNLAGDELTLTDQRNATVTLVWKRVPPSSQALQLRGGRRAVHF